MRRSMLFLPGNTPNIIVNAEILGADAVILDLEDAVAPAEKDSARILVRSAISANGLRKMRGHRAHQLHWTRTTGGRIWTRFFPCSPDLIMPAQDGARPRTCCAWTRTCPRIEEKLGLPEHSVGLIPLIETARGVENAYAIASACPRVKAIFLGGEDLTADLRCKRTKGGEEIRYARSRMVMAARAAGVDVYDTPFTDVNDDEGIYDDARYAKSLGFTGKACNLARATSRRVNEVFSPTKAEVDYAYEGYGGHRASARSRARARVSLRGKMIDAPIVARAQQTLEAAEVLGMGRSVK